MVAHVEQVVGSVQLLPQQHPRSLRVERLLAAHKQRRMPVWLLRIRVPHRALVHGAALQVTDAILLKDAAHFLGLVLLVHAPKRVDGRPCCHHDALGPARVPFHKLGDVVYTALVRDPDSVLLGLMLRHLFFGVLFSFRIFTACCMDGWHCHPEKHGVLSPLPGPCNSASQSSSYHSCSQSGPSGAGALINGSRGRHSSQRVLLPVRGSCS
mmetsp:Transcript_14915/g.45020  ORF Transcript_14915/g.45020 Transcript_14915/m.45020 type:complete len:211 (-) Transcript_14915:311-943(-)